MHLRIKGKLKSLNKANERQLSGKYIQYWSQQINSEFGKNRNRGGNKLRTYSKFKLHFRRQKYLFEIEDAHPE